MITRETERQLWTSVAASFATTSVDRAIASLLKKLGELHNIDHVFFIRFKNRLKSYSMTHEWSRDNKSPILANAQDQPFYRLLEVYSQIQESEKFIVNDVRKIAQGNSALKKTLADFGICAAAMLPVHGDRCIGGLVGYAQKETRNWNEMEIEMLRCSAKILGRILMQGNTPHFFLERAKYTKALQGNDTESLPFQDILRIQSDRNYTKVVMSDGKIYTELRSLAEWLKILPPGIFARVHRSHLINIAHAVRVVKIGSMCKIEFEGEGIDIPVGRAYRANLKKLTLRS